MWVHSLFFWSSPQKNSYTHPSFITISLRNTLPWFTFGKNYQLRKFPNKE